MGVQAAPLTKSALFSELKATDESQGVFEGYLSVFGNLDSYKDIVERGAFQKTINDARGRKSPYLFPLLWQHDPREPIGGFLDMKEDAHGLFVKGQIDLTIPRGQQAYSGIKMGYLNGLSIGYDTIKHKYVGEVRHLLEVRMWEGSVVTFPANTETRVEQVKSACGSTDWPIAGRDVTWDGSKAHTQIVEWATKEDGTLDTGKMKSVHFYVDDGDPQKITSYKMPFCFIQSGSPTAIPRGIFACAAVMQGARGGGNFGDADDAMKSKIASYYTRMKKQFDDDTIVPPWTEKSNGNEEHEEEKEEDGMSFASSSEEPEKKHDGEPRDFASVMKDRAPDEVIEDLYDLMGALMCVILESVYGYDDPKECQDNVTRSITQFNGAISEWLDDAWDAGLGQDDEDEMDVSPSDQKMPPVYKSYVLTPSMTVAHFTMSTRALKQATHHYLKEGRMLSTATRSRISSALDSIMQSVEDLKDLLDKAGNEYIPNGENEQNPPEKNDDEDREGASAKQESDEPTRPASAQNKKEDDELSEEEMTFFISTQLERMRASIR